MKKSLHTCNEYIQDVNIKLRDIDEIILKYGFSNIQDIVPGLMHMNNIETFSMERINKLGTEYLGYSEKEIQDKGEQLILEICEPDNLVKCSEKLIKLIELNDPTKVTAYFQHIKLKNSEDYKWFLTTSKISKNGKIISISNPINIFGKFSESIEKILGRNDYRRKNLYIFEQLTKREKEIISFIAKGLSTQQIAEALQLSKLTIDTHRKNLNLKLGTSKINEIYHFAREFRLV